MPGPQRVRYPLARCGLAIRLGLRKVRIMQAYKVPGSGAWVVYGEIKGYLVTRTYYFSNKRDAIKSWREEVAK